MGSFWFKDNKLWFNEWISLSCVLDLTGTMKCRQLYHKSNEIPPEMIDFTKKGVKITLLRQQGDEPTSRFSMKTH